MADTTFTDAVTVLVAAWAQDVNNTVYRALGTGGVAPATAAAVVANLGAVTLTGAQTLTNKVYVGLKNSPTYSTSITPNAALANWFIITATDGVGFTINAPSNATTGQSITFTIKNTSGGAMGTLTWDAVFKKATFTNPANSNNRSVTFNYDGTNWIQVAQTGTDVPN
jgi:hypothetical protein